MKRPLLSSVSSAVAWGLLSREQPSKRRATAIPVLASLQLRGIFGATSAGEMVAARGIIVGEHSGHKSGQA
jgi:hypothetical protein